MKKNLIGYITKQGSDLPSGIILPDLISRIKYLSSYFLKLLKLIFNNKTELKYLKVCRLYNMINKALINYFSSVVIKFDRVLKP